MTLAWFSHEATVERLEFRDASGAVRSWTQWTYEPQRDLIDTVENHFGPLASSTLVSKYDYTNDGRADTDGVPLLLSSAVAR